MKGGRTHCCHRSQSNKHVRQFETDENVVKLSPGPYRFDQGWIGTVEMALCGEPSITRSL